MKTKSTWIYTIILFIIIIAFMGWLIVMQVREYYLQDDPKLRELREIIKPLFERDNYYSGMLAPLNDKNIMNEITLYKGDKSYTINKQKIFLCLKDEKKEYYNTNMLVYVLLHEISHVICDEVGHTEKFNKIFDELLSEATKVGVYDPSVPIIQDYCQY
jgi:uncharacterized protein YneF (UPF0154 family)